jgi:hypothetical protein
MRLIFLLLLLAGIGIAAYPAIDGRIGARAPEILRALDGGVSTPLQVPLSPQDAPVRLGLSVAASGVSANDNVATVTVSVAGHPIAAEVVGTATAEVREDGPQTPQKIYVYDLGVIDVTESGVYAITVAPADADTVTLMSADVEITRGAVKPDSRILPIGLSLVVVGFIGLVASLRAGPRTIPEDPSRPRWGRGAAVDK